MFELFKNIITEYMNNIGIILFYVFIISIFSGIVSDLVYRFRHK